ncbi:MAG: hypothetical protein FD177_2567 [Desulfovibrionaceae bacterium]|nr:MAG: hypothetical protein FD177_2567 [Desulfovibrionaceae bacterium]
MKNVYRSVSNVSSVLIALLLALSGCNHKVPKTAEEAVLESYRSCAGSVFVNGYDVKYMGSSSLGPGTLAHVGDNFYLAARPDRYIVKDIDVMTKEKEYDCSMIDSSKTVFDAGASVSKVLPVGGDIKFALDRAKSVSFSASKYQWVIVEDIPYLQMIKSLKEDKVMYRDLILGGKVVYVYAALKASKFRVQYDFKDSVEVGLQAQIEKSISGANSDVSTGLNAKFVGDRKMVVESVGDSFVLGAFKLYKWEGLADSSQGNIVKDVSKIDFVIDKEYQ